MSIVNIILHIIASIGIVYLGHMAWEYIKGRYSIAKTKDLVNIQTQKYKQIIADLQESIAPSSPSPFLFSETEIEKMNNDLVQYTQDLAEQ